MSDTEASYQAWLGLFGGLIAIGVAVATYFRGVIQQNQKIHTLELDLKTVETRFNVFWAIVEKELPKILIKPHRPDIDELLIKMTKTKEGLTEEERASMAKKMRDALDHGIAAQDSALALGYALMIARIESELETRKKETK